MIEKAKSKKNEKAPQIFVREITPVFSNLTQVTHGDDQFSFTFIHMFLKQTNVPRGRALGCLEIAVVFVVVAISGVSLLVFSV